MKNWFYLLLFPLLLLGEMTLVPATDELPPHVINPAQRCPVCHMYCARYLRWNAQIVFKDGTMSAFDSPRDLFRFLNDMAKYDDRYRPQDVGRIYVRDWGKWTWTDARKAYFLSGSTLTGPMRGPDYPAFSTRKDAEDMAASTSSGNVLTFDQALAEVAAGGDQKHHHH
jgi:nitrous oxide reductase accessory protein NosL